MMIATARALSFAGFLLLLLEPSKGFSLHPTSRRESQANFLRPSPSSRLNVVSETTGKNFRQEEGEQEEQFFFIRQCLPAEVGAAADILTEAFFKSNTNPFTYQLERLTTYLSLEGTYPKPGSRHALLVACHVKDGKVLGLAEIDDRPTEDPKATPRPYMFNVAVDSKWQRKGIAKALVLSCEAVARRRWDKTYVYLKVRASSEPATTMYESLGYVTRESRLEKLNKKYLDLLIMSKDISLDQENTDRTVQDLGPTSIF